MAQYASREDRPSAEVRHGDAGAAGGDTGGTLARFLGRSGADQGGRTPDDAPDFELIDRHVIQLFARVHRPQVAS